MLVTHGNFAFFDIPTKTSVPDVKMMQQLNIDHRELIISRVMNYAWFCNIVSKASVIVYDTPGALNEGCCSGRHRASPDDARTSTR